MVTVSLGSIHEPGLLDFVESSAHLGTRQDLVGMKQDVIVCFGMWVLRRLSRENHECEASIGATGKVWNTEKRMKRRRVEEEEEEKWWGEEGAEGGR